jgi:hypothetical protein
MSCRFLKKKLKKLYIFFLKKIEKKKRVKCQLDSQSLGGGHTPHATPRCLLEWPAGYLWPPGMATPFLFFIFIFLLNCTNDLYEHLKRRCFPQFLLRVHDPGIWNL